MENAAKLVRLHVEFLHHLTGAIVSNILFNYKLRQVLPYTLTFNASGFEDKTWDCDLVCECRVLTNFKTTL
jgi:hypothetical protein